MTNGEELLQWLRVNLETTSSNGGLVPHTRQYALQRPEPARPSLQAVVFCYKGVSMNDELVINCCPFCESNDVQVEIFQSDDAMQVCVVRCNGCGAQGPESLTPRIATILWNGAKETNG